MKFFCIFAEIIIKNTLMNKTNENKLRMKALILAISLFVAFLGLSIYIGNSSFEPDSNNWVWWHSFAMIVSCMLTLTFAILSIVEGVQWDERGYGAFGFIYRKPEPVDTAETVKTFSFKKYITYAILAFIGIWCYFGIKSAVNDSIKIYNTSKMCQNTYQRKVEEKMGFYDKLWKTYLQKEKITNINKETFIEVSKIIMENRKDGQSIMWKWVQENQQIPYGEFTAFYKDLSNFITEQREGYFNIEKECQMIANQNNTLLDTFPNNMYNKVLNLPRIKFEYGFTSDSTINVFKSKKENL